MKRLDLRFDTGCVRWLAVLVGLAVVAAADRTAAQSTVAELLPRCPSLVSTDASLQSFEFSGIFPIGGARMEYAWSRSDGYFLALTDPKSGVPTFVATDDRAVQFVAADGALELNADFRLTFTMTVADEKLGFGFGRMPWPTKDVAGVSIDLPSFITSIDAAKWQRVDAPGLRYTAPSPNGDLRMYVDFDPAQAYPLTRLEVKSADGANTVLLVDELRVNQPLRRKLKPFPNDAEFPRDLLIARLGTPAATDSASNMALLLKIAMRVNAAAGIDDLTRRAGPEKLEKIDWNAAAANRAKFGPALIKLFEP